MCLKARVSNIMLIREACYISGTYKQSLNLEACGTMTINKKDILNGKKNQEEKKMGFLITDLRQIPLLPPRPCSPPLDL